MTQSILPCRKPLNMYLVLVAIAMGSLLVNIFTQNMWAVDSRIINPSQQWIVEDSPFHDKLATDNGPKNHHPRGNNIQTQSIVEEPRQRELTFQDLTIGTFFAHGAVNVVYRVKLPDWWYEQNSQIDRNQQYILKLAAGGEDGDLEKDYWMIAGNMEADVLETLHQNNHTEATRLGILDYVFLARNMPNPFYQTNNTTVLEVRGKLNGQRRSRQPTSVSRIPNQPFLVAFVVPLIQVAPYESIKTLNKTKIFLQSLLEQLDYAHSFGLSNQDLSVRNVKVNIQGKAVIVDWNGGVKNGQPLYQDDAAMQLVPPEAMLENVMDGVPILQTVASAVDIWEVGILLVTLLSRDCHWVNQKMQRGAYYNLLRENLIHIGGDSLIPIGNDQFFDIAPLAGLNRSQLLKTLFRPPLFDQIDRDNQVPCTVSSFSLLQNATSKDIAEVSSFLEFTMKLNPKHRPTAAALLQHPFLN